MGLGGGGGGMGGMGGMGGGKWGRGGGDDRDMSRDGVLMYREAPMPPAYVTSSNSFMIDLNGLLHVVPLHTSHH